MELNRIYNENCIETMARMPDGFIDLTVTSPPYDNLRKYNGYSFDFPAVAQGLYRVTKDGGVVVWVVNDKTVDGDESGTSFRQALYFKEIGFKLWDTMIFAKNNPFPGERQMRYRQAFEFTFVLSKSTPKTFNGILIPTLSTKGGGFGRLGSNGRETYKNPRMSRPERLMNNVMFYTVGAEQLDGQQHPAVFPEQLARDQIATWSNPNDIVYDCFMGSGTTAKAAHQLQRRWIGSEISAEYVEMANKRLEPYLAQESLFRG